MNEDHRQHIDLAPTNEPTPANEAAPDSSSEASMVVVGQESRENLRLSDMLRKLHGREQVFRHLETEHMLAFLDENADTPIVVFADLFSFDLERVTSAIQLTRDRHPRVVFCMYLDQDAWQIRRAELPDGWSLRLDHYYRLYHAAEDEEFEPVVRQVSRMAVGEALYNFGHEPIRITERFSKGVLPALDAGRSPVSDDATLFVSYSRTDWDDAVARIAEQLQRFGFQMWIDQGFLVGGSDWMDAIGEALKKCGACLLVMSPEAMESKYVKMEYRYFLKNDKPIVPVMVKLVGELPWELSGIQHFDFTKQAPSPPWDDLRRAVATHAGS